MWRKVETIENGANEQREELEEVGPRSGQDAGEIESQPESDPDLEPPAAAADLLYKIEDVPPWYMCILLGLQVRFVLKDSLVVVLLALPLISQHYMTMFGGTVSQPFIIAPALCMEENDPGRAYVMSTLFFVSGLVTLLQSTVGVR